MLIESICPISGESEREERINYLTHLFGLGLSFVGWIILVFYASLSQELLPFTSCFVYGATLVLLYGASFFYHYCKVPVRKRILRIVDHSCIYLLIAGSYTPYTLMPLLNDGGWYILCFEWSVAILGIFFKIKAIGRFEWMSVIAYLCMGWLIMFSIPVLIEELPSTSLTLLIAGGLSYSCGVLFYAWNSLPFNHAIWHVFVLGGSICHYFSILTLVMHRSLL